MDLEFYTFEQAARVLGCEADEVEHFVELFKLPVHIYAKNNKFIITHEGYGRALVTYRGLFPLAKKHVLTLFSDAELFIKDEVVLQSSGIIEWKKALKVPEDIYIREVGLKVNGWIETAREELGDERELKGLVYCHMFAENVQQKHQERRQKEIEEFGSTDLEHYDYVSFEEYYMSNLRISHADLMEFKEKISVNEKDEKAVSVLPQKTELSINIEKTRANELHDLILRVLVTDQDKSARQVWKSIEKDFKKNIKDFDTDEIITDISRDELTWVSSYGHEQKHKFTSFASTVSRKKKELREYYSRQE